jgi:hypothetical protein
MKYPCIPMWMKQREFQDFDYPLLSRKEMLLEQHIKPPNFNAKIITTDYAHLYKFKSFPQNTVDKRATDVKLELNMSEMGLGPLQKKRLIFLLGPRYQNSDIFKIVVRQFHNQEYNMTRAIELLRQLFWEAKRAPPFIWERMKNRQRVRLKRTLLGKNLTQKEINEKLNGIVERYNKIEKEFNEVYESGNYTPEYLKNHLLKNFSQGEHDENEQQNLEQEKAEKDKQEEIQIARNALEESLIKKRVLTQKAYDTFFKKDLDDVGETK